MECAGSCPNLFSIDSDIFSLDSIISNLPKELLQKSTRKAFGSLLSTLALCISGYILLALVPWYSLPLVWIFLGCSFTAMFSIGHDCSRGSFSRFPLVNSVIGTLVSLPLLLPYETWRMQELYKFTSLEKISRIERAASGKWTWFTTSVSTWLSTNLIDLPKVWQPGNRRKIVFSLLSLHLFSLSFFTTLLLTLGPWGVVKFWLLPWLAYHFWMSTFYCWVYRIPFSDNMSIRLTIAFPTKLPRLINFLTNDISYVLSLSKALASENALKIRRNIPNHSLKRTLELVLRLISASGKMEINDDDNNNVGSKEDSIEIWPTPNDNLPLWNMFVIWPKLLTSWLIIQPIDTLNRILPRIYHMYTLAITALDKVNWVTAIWLLSTPIAAIYGIFTTPIMYKTMILSGIGYLTAGLGITVGYHRMFSHRAFSASWPLRLFILLCGTSALEGSCLWWARDHRAHHRYVDTDKDPYSSKAGFFWAHMGWLLVKQDKKAIGKADCSDLLSDPLMKWQHEYYAPLAVFSAIILPTCIAGFGWGDWRGGFFYATIARNVLVLQSTFCVNSLAHYVGSFTFSDAHTPRDCYWVSLLTFGEGYHNFHHEFPYDYRNGVHWYAYDPSKWTIWIFSLIKLANNLKRFPSNEIEKGRLQMIQKITLSALNKLDWGLADSQLPDFTMDDVRARVQEGSSLLTINNHVYDVSRLMPDHPGGEAILKAYIGKDATKAFTGAVYGHSNAAQNLLWKFRVGKIIYQ